MLRSSDLVGDLLSYGGYRMALPGGKIGLGIGECFSFLQGLGVVFVSCSSHCSRCLAAPGPVMWAETNDHVP